MTKRETQLTIRFSDEALKSIDRLVRQGIAKDRTAYIRSAVRFRIAVDTKLKAESKKRGAGSKLFVLGDDEVEVTEVLVGAKARKMKKDILRRLPQDVKEGVESG